MSEGFKRRVDGERLAEKNTKEMIKPAWMPKGLSERIREREIDKRGEETSEGGQGRRQGQRARKKGVKKEANVRKEATRRRESHHHKGRKAVYGLALRLLCCPPDVLKTITSTSRREWKVEEEERERPKD